MFLQNHGSLALLANHVTVSCSAARVQRQIVPSTEAGVLSAGTRPPPPPFPAYFGKIFHSGAASARSQWSTNRQCPLLCHHMHSPVGVSQQFGIKVLQVSIQVDHRTVTIMNHV